MAIIPLLLAAGASTRMGRAKALCAFDGKTALELALESCREAALGRPVVVLGFGADTIRKSLEPGQADVVVNADPDRGQTSSLKEGIAHLPRDAEAFLIYPVDHPLITADEIRPLVNVWRRQETAKQIFIPSYNLKRGHPVLVDRALADDFLVLPDDAPARTVLSRQAARIHHVEVTSPAVLMDMDTPADYERCLQAYRDRVRRRGREEVSG